MKLARSQHVCNACAQIHEEAQRKAEAEAAAVMQARQAAASQSQLKAHQAEERYVSFTIIQAQQESEAKKRYSDFSL